MKKKFINYPLLIIVGIVICVITILGLGRLDVDTDVIKSLPQGEQVIADALEIFQNHPIHDQVAVDIMIDRDNPDLLLECSALLEEKMRASGLFAEVGLRDIGGLIPELALQIVRDLPLLFTKEELERDVAPRLEKAPLQRRVHELWQNLSSMEGIGQASFIGSDPLGLKDLVMARMAQLAPTLHSRFYKGSLISADGRHLLVTAKPVKAGTDTAAAREISQLIEAGAKALTEKYTPLGLQVTVTPVGAYRAALDNEDIIRHDVRLALLLSTAGIALLLLISFPRPLLGLLSLVPALAGAAAALFVYSLFHSSISIMVLGFGGALISINVDYGIAYLLFLDRPHETQGKHAAHEARMVGSMMSLLTTVGAFLVLSLSGFPIFTELGQFTALGLLFTYLFVHSIFPLIIPTLPPGTDRALPLHRLVNLLYNTGKPGAIAALLLALFLLFFARPDFQISLSSMNTVSDKTHAADALFTKTWGNIGEKVYLMTKGASIDEIQQQGDRLLAKIDQDLVQGKLAAAFVPSMLFPGRERSRQNLASWQKFWNKERTEQVQQELNGAGGDLGFAADAFTPFFALLTPSSQEPKAVSLPPRYNKLLGITENKQTGELIQFITLTPGKQYDAAGFLNRYGEDGRIFDGAYFSKRLGDLLFSTFATGLLIIAVSVVILLFLYFLNWQLTLITLVPPLFAYICTLGTLKLIGHPLDIPGLMLSIVILGMGIDYAIYTVCGHQWYGSAEHPSYVLVRSTVFMAAASTLIGFGVLCFAQHSSLRSVGITSLCGIAYSLLGAFLLLPPLLHWYFSKNEQNSSRETNISRRIMNRYRHLEAYPRMFVRFKLRFDPLCNDLSHLLAGKKDIRTILDIGCGYGVPACWCLEQFPDARIFGMEPNADRVRVAARVTGARGIIAQDQAPALPAVSQPVDVILLLDMLHYLDDDKVLALLKKGYQALAHNGILVTRFVTYPAGKRSWAWYLEHYRTKLAGIRPWYRSTDSMVKMMTAAGFVVAINRVAAANAELGWLVCRADKEA